MHWMALIPWMQYMLHMVKLSESRCRQFDRRHPVFRSVFDFYDAVDKKGGLKWQLYC
jgi:hypothetical protein